MHECTSSNLRHLEFYARVCFVMMDRKMQAVDEDDEDKKDDMITFSTKLYQREGLAVFLRGIETSAFQSALEKALYFFAYTFLKEAYGLVYGSGQIAPAPNLALGCLAEWAHLPVSMPVDCKLQNI